MAQYAVEQGDHLSSIAEKFGFRDYNTVWNDAGNSDLQQNRQNPNVLLPGDQVNIPEKLAKSETRGTGATHTFKVPAPKLELRIVTHDINDNPVANEKCTLQVEAQVFTLTTDSTGLIDQKIAADAVNGLFQVFSMDIPVKIGYLDPSDSDSGGRERLTNLGYYWGPQDDSDPMSLRSAIEEFQCDHGLPVNGKLDVATRSRLEQEHGC